MLMAANTSTGTFLHKLSVAFQQIGQGDEVPTHSFAEACQAILPVFDNLGKVFAFPRKDMQQKQESLEKVAPQLSTLSAVIAADKKAGTVTVKGSPSRNLHRLLASISFIAMLLQNLGADPKCTLHKAAANAYSGSMAHMHNFVVRTAVKASMYTLPTREYFLSSIGETESSAKAHASVFVPQAKALIARIERMFGGVSMPRSDTTWTG